MALARARRAGDPSNRCAMLIDLRHCIGCQASTVSCRIENAAPLGKFRTIVSQYKVENEAAGERAQFMLPRLCNHCDNPPCDAVMRGVARGAAVAAKGGADRSERATSDASVSGGPRGSRG